MLAMREPLPTGVDLSKLSDLLSNKLWREADHETYLAMCLVMRRSSNTGLRIEDFPQLPSEELSEIDRLWSDASAERFGFAAQLKQLEAVKEEPQGFAVAVGWIAHGNWIAYSDAVFAQTAPVGHLPIGWRGGFCGGIGDAGQGRGLIGEFDTAVGILSSTVSDFFNPGGYDRFWKRLGDDLKGANGYSKAWMYQRLLLLRRFADC
jgi:hypothetical protein